MPWYKIYADHGPGHQSHSCFYKYENKKLSKDESEYLFNEYFRDRDWPIGYVKIVKSLPERVKESKIKGAEGTIVEMKQLLKVLKKTKGSIPKEKK